VRDRGTTLSVLSFLFGVGRLRLINEAAAGRSRRITHHSLSAVSNDVTGFRTV
jgi:hypothetical protein